MADRYFDRNGSTAGFGTLTGAWNTSSAFWSTSSAGTAVPGTFTFTSADRAFFGAAGADATAGTATIADGITVTLNGITTANLAGLQTIARTTSGALTIAGTTPSVTVTSAGGLTISAPIGGSTAWTSNGTGILALTSANGFSAGMTISLGVVQIGNNSALGTGTVTMTGGQLSSNSTTARTLANPLTLNGTMTLGDATNNGLLTLSGALTIAGTTTLSIPANYVLGQGVFNGTEAFALASGELDLEGITGTKSGGTTISGGTLFLGFGKTLPDQLGSDGLTINSGSAFFCGSSNSTNTNPITGSGGFLYARPRNAVVTFSNAGAYTGTLRIFAGASDGVGTMTQGMTLSSFPTSATDFTFINQNTGTAVTQTFKYTGSASVNAITPTMSMVPSVASSVGVWHHAPSNSTATMSFAGAVASNTSVAHTIRFTNDSSGLLSFSGGVDQRGAGVMAVSKTGTGPVSISGTGTYTGSVSVSNGTLNANSTTALGAASSTTAISVTSGATLSLGAALNYSSPGRTTTISGTGVSTGGALIHNYAGTVHVGVISLGSAGYIRGTATGSLTSGITATTGALTLGAAASTVFTLPGAMSSNLLLTLANSSSDTGEVILSGFNSSSLTGAITVNYGTLSFANQNAVGAIGTITLTRFGSVVQFNAGTTSNRPITGRGEIALKATGAYSFGQITIAGGNGSAFGGNALGLTAYETATLTSTVDFLSSTSYIQEFYPKAKAGKTLTLQGAIYSNINSNPNIYYWAETGGSVVISGTNYYNGYSTLYEGTIQAASPESSGVSGPFGINTTSGAISMYNTGTLQYSTLNAADYSGRFDTTGGEKWKIDTNGQSVTFASTLQGAGSLVQKLGTGTLTLTAANTYTGSTTVTTGTLRAGNTQAFGTTGTAILASGATLQTLTAAGQNGKLTVAALNNSAGGTIKIGG